MGTHSRKWNPNMSPYIGVRQNIHILDLTHSVSRMNKYFLFLQLVAANHGYTMFILRPDAAVLSPRIVCLGQMFSSRWIPGILTNYAYVGYFLAHSDTPYSYIPRKYPSASLCFPNNKALNEAFLTRTPCAFLADNTSDVNFAAYGINGNPSLPGFRTLAELALTAISLGKRKSKLSFAKSLAIFYRRHHNSRSKISVKRDGVFPQTSNSIFVKKRRIRLIFYRRHRLLPHLYRNSLLSLRATRLNALFCQQYGRKSLKVRVRKQRRVRIPSLWKLKMRTQRRLKKKLKMEIRVQRRMRTSRTFRRKRRWQLRKKYGRNRKSNTFSSKSKYLNSRKTFTKQPTLKLQVLQAQPSLIKKVPQRRRRGGHIVQKMKMKHRYIFLRGIPLWHGLMYRFNKAVDDNKVQRYSNVKKSFNIKRFSFKTPFKLKGWFINTQLVKPYSLLSRYRRIYKRIRLLKRFRFRKFPPVLLPSIQYILSLALLDPRAHAKEQSRQILAP